MGQQLAVVLAVLAACVFPAAAGSDKTAPEKVILALGNSLTAGYGLAAAEAFPAQLEQALRTRGHRVRVINAGISGDTTAGGRARTGWLLAERPDMVLLELGGNDGLRGIDPAETRANLNAMIEQIQKSGAALLLAGMRAPPNLGADYVNQFNRIYPELAEKHNVLLYPFFLDGVAGDPALNQSDGIHPVARGVEIIVSRILPYVEAVLAGTTETPRID